MVRHRRNAKWASLLACGGMLAGIDPCVPDDYFYNLAAQTRDSFTSNIAEFIALQLTAQFFPELLDDGTDGTDGGTNGDGTGGDATGDKAQP